MHIAAEGPSGNPHSMDIRWQTCGCLTFASTRESIDSTKQVVFPLPLWACVDSALRQCLDPNSAQPVSRKQRAANCLPMNGMTPGRQHVRACATMLRYGGVSTIGNVSACIRDGLSNFISVYKPCAGMSLELYAWLFSDPNCFPDRDKHGAGNTKSISMPGVMERSRSATRSTALHMSVVQTICPRPHGQRGTVRVPGAVLG